LKGFAVATDSLNDTLTRTVSPTINLSGINTIKFDIYSSRIGANVKIGIHDSGGTTTEKTYTVLQINTWETVTWDISGVSNSNKDAIDQIIITIVNADADNTFYIDNFYMDISGTSRGTSLTISNLDGNTDEEYQLICKIINNNNSQSMGYYLRPNNDTGSNYGQQYIEGISTTPSAARQTTNNAFEIGYDNGINKINFAKLYLYAKSGYLRIIIHQYSENIVTTTVGNVNLSGQVWNNTVDNITSLVLFGSATNGLGVGTVIELWRKSKKV
jgi:hypothetical protein